MTNFYHVEYVCTKTDSAIILRKMQLGLWYVDAIRETIKELSQARIIKMTQLNGIVTVIYEAMA
jgi:hypothetical protein